MDHLWFLPALVFSMLFLYVAVRTDRTRELLIVASGLYFIGLIGQTYPVVSIPIPTRDAIFFGTFYTTVGYTIQRTGFRPEKHKRWLYLAAVPIFGVLHVAEWYVRGYLVGSHNLTSSVYVTNYSLLTAAWAISVFLLVLAYPNWGRNQRLPDLGNYAAGIYIVHVPILSLLNELSEQLQLLTGVAIHEQLVWEFLIAPFVFLMSLLFYRAIIRFGLVDISGVHLPKRPPWL